MSAGGAAWPVAGRRDADMSHRVVEAFAEGRSAWGYRTIWARLSGDGIVAS